MLFHAHFFILFHVEMVLRIGECVECRSVQHQIGFCYCYFVDDKLITIEEHFGPVENSFQTVLYRTTYNTLSIDLKNDFTAHANGSLSVYGSI